MKENVITKILNGILCSLIIVKILFEMFIEIMGVNNEKCKI